LPADPPSDRIRNPPTQEWKPCGPGQFRQNISDTLADKETRDMTKSQVIKGAFRMLTLKLGQANIPMIVTNHVYDSMSMYSPKEISGGVYVQAPKFSLVLGIKILKI
jgi:hypothetical protein